VQKENQAPRPALDHDGTQSFSKPTGESKHNPTLLTTLFSEFHPRNINHLAFQNFAKQYYEAIGKSSSVTSIS